LPVELCVTASDTRPFVDTTGGTHFASNSLFLSVITPFLERRTVTEVHVGGSSHSSCSFPGSLIISKDGTCQDVVTGRI